MPLTTSAHLSSPDNYKSLTEWSCKAPILLEEDNGDHILLMNVGTASEIDYAYTNIEDFGVFFDVVDCTPFRMFKKSTAVLNLENNV